MTALHEAQTALREREAHWRTIIENTADIISVSNADGTFSYQSPSIERILGYGQAERIGRPAHEFAHPDDKAQAQQAMARLRADPSSVQALESRVKHKDGRWITLAVTARAMMDGDGEVAGILLNSRDITEQKAAEEALRNSEKTKSDILNATSDSIFLIGPGEIVLEANEAGARRLGLSTAEMIGRPFFNIMPAEVAARRRANWATMIRDRAPIVLVDERDGFWFESVTSPRFDEDGQFLWASVIARDITERRRIEEQLREAGKLDALRQLTGGFAHEFNNLLQATLICRGICRWRWDGRRMVRGT